MDDITLYEYAAGALKIIAVLLGSLVIGMLLGALIRKGGRDDN